MTRTAGALGLAFALCLAPGCDRSSTWEAVLEDGRGIAEGTKVVVANAEVGRVREVRLSGSQVLARFGLDSGNTLMPGASSCAHRGELDGRTVLVLELSDDAPLSPNVPIRACERSHATLDAMMQGIGESMGSLERLLAHSTQGGHANRPVACEHLRAERRPSDPGRVTLVFRNQGTTPLRIPTIGRATFYDASHRPLRLALGDEDWIHAFDLPPGSSAEASFTFMAEGDPTVPAKMELEGVHSANDPTGTECRFDYTFE